MKSKVYSKIGVEAIQLTEENIASLMSRGVVEHVLNEGYYFIQHYYDVLTGEKTRIWKASFLIGDYVVKERDFSKHSRNESYIGIYSPHDFESIFKM